jgi:tetratricopeptide (TPR) repeat protein
MKLKPTQGLFKFDFNDSHAFLGVSIDADHTGIRDRYKEIARLMHPDSARWQTDDEKNMATKMFSSLISHSYGQLSRAALLQEQQVMLELIGKRILAEAGKTDLISDVAKQLYKESSAAMNGTYHRLVRELADQQYQKLDASMEITGQISELNMVYLLRRQNQSIGATPSGGRVNGTVPISGEPTPVSEAASVPEVIKSVENAAKVPRLENSLRRAEEYVAMRNWAKASVELREVLKEDMNNPKAHAQLALVFFRQNQATMAKMHMNKAIQLAPNDPLVKSTKQELKKLIGESSSKSAAADTKGGLFGMFGGKK